MARPDRPVVCIIGDGGFMFNSPELSTAVRYGINVVTIVFRDDSYGNVARDLDDMFDGTYATDLHNPDLVKFTESFGAVGMRTDDPMDLGKVASACTEERRARGHRRTRRTSAAPTRQAAGAPALRTLDTAPGKPDLVLIR